MVVFVFISTTALSLNNDLDIKINNSPKISYRQFPDNPILKNDVKFPIISAQGAIVVDLDSGVGLYEKNPDIKLLPASTTKIVTALVALETYSLDDILTVPQGVSVDGQKIGLYYGEKMSVEDLLYGLLVYSANDAAMTLASNYPGGYEKFVAAMNEKAKSLSMTNSFFENPVGLDGIKQATTARDLLRASEVAMRNAEFAKIVSTKSVQITDVSGRSKYNLKNINELLGNVPGVLGIKTGWTENARENLVTFVERDGHKIIFVVLGGQDRFGETKELIDWVFANYEWQKVNMPIVDGIRQ